MYLLTMQCQYFSVSLSLTEACAAGAVGRGCVSEGREIVRRRGRKGGGGGESQQSQMKRNPNLSINLLSSPVGRCWRDRIGAQVREINRQGE